jgi:hypothetical protein
LILAHGKNKISRVFRHFYRHFYILTASTRFFNP